MTDTLKAGIAGLGFGATEFIPTLERLDEIEIVAGADLRPQARAEFERRYGGRAYADADDLCADPDVEAVWIATPNHLHAANAIAAARKRLSTSSRASRSASRWRSAGRCSTPWTPRG